MENEWECDIFFSHGSNHSRDVCIVINPKCGFSIKEHHGDEEGVTTRVNEKTLITGCYLETLP